MPRLNKGRDITECSEVKIVSNPAEYKSLSVTQNNRRCEHLHGLKLVSGSHRCEMNECKDQTLMKRGV